ncbi:SPARC-like protein 1 [Pelobates fuscus]|uniref:SPARC-like protein 1 n=1 Tax=Pelobates fuscus TaxID=191477 RepID=UPI002FE4E48A
MNIIFLTCFIGIYLVSEVDSLMARHRRRHEQALIGDISKQEPGSQDSSQEKNEDIGIIDLQNIGPEKRLSDTEDFQLEDAISKLGIFPIKYFQNMEKKKDQNEKHTLSIDETHNESKHAHHDLNENHDTVDDNDDYEDSVDTKIETKELSALSKDSQQSTSNEDPSEDNVSSGDQSEEYDASLMKPNFQREELEDNYKKEYINILRQYYNDKDFKYILNSTQDDKNDEKDIETETEEEFINKEEQILNHIISFTPSKNNISVNKDSGNYSDNAQSYSSGHGRNYTTLEKHQMEIPQVDMENTINEKKERTEKGTNDTMYINRIRENEQNGSSRNKKLLVPEHVDHTLLNPTSMENHSILLHDNDIEDDQGDYVFNTLLDQAEDSVLEKPLPDPCRNFHCKRGKMCDIDEEGNPSCVCQEPSACLFGNVNDNVCGTDNKTYESPCHLFGTKCKLEGTKEGNSLHLDYQGSCKYIPHCTDYELAVFPFRMRDWLKNVLLQLYQRDLENSGFLSEKQRDKVKKIYENEKRLLEGDHSIGLLLRDFEKNYHMYVYPVHWQFHQLDRHTVDRLLTRSELAPLRTPLLPMEHCVTAFFQQCNTNSDKHISLKEWCHCFGIKEEEINEDLLF